MKLLAAVCCLLLFEAAPTTPTDGRITALEVRLFDPEKASFTPNVLKDGLYLGWNTFMTEGNGGYGRGDALVIVKLALPNRDGRNFIIEGPLTVTAKTKDKVLAQRGFTAVQVPVNAEISRALYLEDIGCVGRIDVVARLGAQTETARVEMACGE